jgi:hypothetical protein
VQNGDSQPEIGGVISRDSILRMIESHLELQTAVLNHAARR